MDTNGQGADEPLPPPAEAAAPAEAAGAAEHQGDPLAGALARRLRALLGPELNALHEIGDDALLPAWRRVTRGEPRLPVSIAVIAAIVLQSLLPDAVAPHPRWALPVIAALLLVGIVVSNPRRIDRPSKPLRTATLVLIAVITTANIWSAGRLVTHLVEGSDNQTPASLLATGGAIWLTNVVVFSLWYWEFDRDGPGARAQATDPYPDFLFAQMQSPELSPPDWEPGFVDYLYLSFTNATAFSPTDVLPLSRWAKITMMAQSAVSLAVVALVVARAVNILK